MEITKNKLLEETYHLFMEAGFSKIRPDIMDDISDDHIMGFGTTLDEKIFQISGLKELLERQKKQSEGMNLEWEIKPLHRHISADENTAIYADDLFLHVTVGSEIFEIYLRFSIVLEYKNEKWFVVHWHGSKPENVESEKDTYGIEKWKQKAEALEKLVEERTADLVVKNRELEIEAALERVRSRSMAMHNSADLSVVVFAMFTELVKLDAQLDRCLILIVNPPTQAITWYLSGKEGLLSNNGFVVPDNQHPSHKAYLDGWRVKRKQWQYFLAGEEKKQWDAFGFSQTELSQLPAFIKADMESVEAIHLTISSDDFGCLIASSISPLSAAHAGIVERFAIVFNQTYTRFLDLQKAEAQAREAQIEAALEKVRSTSLAIHQSQELEKVVVVLFDKLKDLEVPFDTTFIYFFDKPKKNIEAWVATKQLPNPLKVYMPYEEDMANNPIIADLWYALENGEDGLNRSYKGKEKDDYYRYEARHNKSVIPEEITNFCVQAESWTTSFATEENSIMGFDSWSGQQIKEDEFKILKRFAKVFEQAYVRFLDLQKAEAQAREAQIEAALERVRSRTMAMHNSSELIATAEVIFEQLKQLGAESLGVAFAICEPDDIMVKKWTNIGIFSIPYTDEEGEQKMYEAWKNQEDLHEEIYEGERIQKYYELFLKFPAFKEGFDKHVANGYTLPSWQKNHAAIFKHGYLLFITTKPFEETYIFVRFAKVFEQAYTRFLDLQKAEVQAREAQVETALERVRSRTMAMRHSSELSETATILFRQLKQLGAELWTCGFALCEKENELVEKWMGSPITGHLFNRFIIPYTADNGEQSMYDAWKNGIDLYSYVQEGEELKTIYEHLMTIPSFRENYKELLESGISFPVWQKFYIAPYRYGYLLIITTKPFDEEPVFIRFAKVFEQTYTRFLDLQKAEAQAREAQIQLALERIRAKTMAMQHSGELREIAAAVHDQILGLGFTSGFCSIVIMDRISGDMTWWMFFPGKEYPESYHMHFVEHPFYLAQLNNWKEGKKYSVIEVSGEEKKSYDKYTFGQTEFKNIPIESQQFMMSFEKIIFSNAYMKHGAFSWGVEPIDDEHAVVLQRFANVFEQCYTRFLDLQKAEVQAREAQIEAALERVRAVAMSMMKSDDLLTICQSVFTQLQVLGFENLRAAQIYIRNDEEKKFMNYDYAAVTGAVKVDVNYNSHPNTRRIYDVIRNAGDGLVYNVIEKEKLEEWKSYLYNTLAQQPEESLDTADGLHYYLYSFGIGAFGICTFQAISSEELDILKRFRNVFNLSYQRYVDIALAEAQALEAIKRASVDRVRAEIASMRTTGDLERIQPLIWNELKVLGVPFIRCGVFIMDEEKQEVNTLLSTPDGKAIAAFRLPYYSTHQSTQIVSHWQQNKLFKDHMDEAAFAEYTQNLVQQGVVPRNEKYVTENRPTDLYLHFLPFMQGMLYAGNTAPLSDDELQLVQNLADTFSTAYARYEDFNKLEAAKRQVENTLNELQLTQKQLIQSEKMASLGELTAGIAHEIQNPLNFVNNFSEVSYELIDEMKTEFKKGDTEEGYAIADDIKLNLEKINHHGKRADAIVKGMLAHSRTSTGQNEPTDINSLCDEYLRLAYHGMKAKDNGFEASFHFEPDNTLPKVNLVPQDIGRVLLNLFNNAFQAVAERKKVEGEYFNPEVKVSTKLIFPPAGLPAGTAGGLRGACISISDNGNGIPPSILDKIFQPFFTTKPTGQGTGLGLSLSYDIVKAHGGIIEVESIEGEGTTFVVKIPII